VEVTVAVENTGDEPLAINGRLLVNHPWAPPSERELSFDIDGPPDFVNLRRVHVNAGAAGPEDFVVLSPGGEIECRVELTEYSSMHLPGLYRVRATYENQAFGPLAGMRAWTGVLQSDGIAVERVNRQGDGP
jgi:hypothetical protein